MKTSHLVGLLAANYEQLNTSFWILNEPGVPRIPPPASSCRKERKNSSFFSQRLVGYGTQWATSKDTKQTFLSVASIRGNTNIKQQLFTTLLVMGCRTCPTISPTIHTKFSPPHQQLIVDAEMLGPLARNVETPSAWAAVRTLVVKLLMLGTSVPLVVDTLVHNTR